MHLEIPSSGRRRLAHSQAFHSSAGLPATLICNSIPRQNRVIRPEKERFWVRFDSFRLCISNAHSFSICQSEA